MSVAVHVRTDRGAIQRLTVDPKGPVGVDLTRRAIRVESRAKTLCPVDTGRLRSSIRRAPLVRRDGGLVAVIGTDVAYSVMVHEGTRYMRGRPFLRNALPAAR